MMTRFPAPRALSLVELMIAVSVLSVGIVFVLRSFLTCSSALEHTSIKIKALQILEQKISALEEKSRLEKGVLPGRAQESLILANREADFQSFISPIDEEEFKDEINSVELNLSWKEGGSIKSEAIFTYVLNKE